MAAFKDELDASAGRRLARELSAAWPQFPTRRFTRGLGGVLEPLELLARSDSLSERLAATLPTPFTAGADVLYGALESPTFTGWIVMPCGGFVARAGLDDEETALPLLAALTGRWSSEFALRPFLEHRRATTYEYLHRWVDADDDEHLRRLVSEGTRPRLPWARQLRFLVNDPSPNIPLLDRLVDDPSAYVRRSVANHLNDIAKDHPALALELGGRWIGRSVGGEALVRHGLRTLIKRGDRDALALLGAGNDRVELLSLVVDKSRIQIGDSVDLSVTLALPKGSAASETIIDYRIHYIGANGHPKAPKVFKLARHRIEPGQPVTFRRRHDFEHVSIRRIHPGRHRIDVQVNGTVLGSVSVEVT